MTSDLFTHLPKTSRGGSASATTLSDISWPDLSAQTPPSTVHTNADGGQVRVWLPDPGARQRGAFSTLNISECPSSADVSLCLADILEKADIPQRYYLSAKAATGILRRAAKRGKTLPPVLRTALKAEIWFRLYAGR